MPAVVFVFQRADGQVLLEQRQPDDTFFGGQWIYPGGKIDPDENPVAALEREIREELGVEHPLYYPLYVGQRPLYHRKRDPNHLVLPFLVVQWSGDLPDHVLDGAPNRLGWFDPHRLLTSRAGCVRPISRRVLEFQRGFFREDGV